MKNNKKSTHKSKRYSLDERIQYHQSRINNRDIGFEERSKSREMYNRLLTQKKSTKELKEDLQEMKPRFSSWREQRKYQNTVNELQRRKTKGINFKSLWRIFGFMKVE
jgi:hypothetical protein